VHGTSAATPARLTSRAARNGTEPLGRIAAASSPDEANIAVGDGEKRTSYRGRGQIAVVQPLTLQYQVSRGER
jgi:hypothetical protein